MSVIKQISFKGQIFFIGIDVHLKSWEVTIRHNHMKLNPTSPRNIKEWSKTGQIRR